MKLTKRSLGYAATAAVVVALLAWWAWPEPRIVETARANRGPVQVTIEEDGETRAIDRYGVASPVAGRLLRVMLRDQLGLSSDHSWNAGIEAGWLVSPALRLTASYSYEQDKLDMAAAVPNATTNPATCNSVPTGTTLIPLACTWGDNLTQSFHTVLASADWKAIPSKLDFRLSYIASWQQESHDFAPCPGNFLNCNGVAIAGATPSQVGLPWPDNTALYQRFDATARYYVDPDVVRLMGWKGQVVAKLRYTFERNSGSFWQSDALNAYFGTLTGNTELTGASRSTWLAYNNPNYTAQLIAGPASAAGG